MYGCGGLLPSGQMALRIPAIVEGDLQVVIVVEMARSTCRNIVPQRKRKSGGAVIEVCPRPTYRCVATTAAC